MPDVFYLTAQQVLTLPAINYALKAGETVTIRANDHPDLRAEGGFFAIIMSQPVKTGYSLKRYQVFPFTGANVATYLRGRGETIPATFRAMVRSAGTLLAVGDPNDLLRGF